MVASVRIKQLDKKLAILHKKTIDACLIASSGVESPVESAAFVRELLGNFKGELIRRCKEGKKPNYQRIADNLALDNLKSIVIEEQTTYNEIHHELSEIVKSKVTVAKFRMLEFLSLVEDHTFAVTISLDPENLILRFNLNIIEFKIKLA